MSIGPATSKTHLNGIIPLVASNKAKWAPAEPPPILIGALTMPKLA